MSSGSSEKVGPQGLTSENSAPLDAKVRRPRRLYVAPRLESWSNIKIPTAFGEELSLSGDGLSSCGLLMAFSSVKAFRKQYPKEYPLSLTLTNPQPTKEKENLNKQKGHNGRVAKNSRHQNR